ncbi:MAG: hypothetical protein L6427_00385 [Actinomycetia bacterium]|nr:hypothetical protein [Actinomycetes bacterium]
MGSITKKHVVLGILVVVAAVAAVVLALAFLPGGSSGIPPLDAPEECANKPVQGKLTVSVDEEELPRVPEKLTVCELEIIAKTREEIQELAAKLGISEELKFEKRSSEEYDYYEAGEGDLLSLV